MVAGGLLVAAISPKRHVLWVLWGFAISCLSLALTALTPAQMFPVAVAMWAVSGVTYIAGNAPFTALLQSIVPNHLQGRVLSLLATIMGLASPIGLAIATPLGEWIASDGSSSRWGYWVRSSRYWASPRRFCGE